MAKKVGDLIKEARSNAGLTQAALAEKVDGASASDIGKAERGEKQLTTEQLKDVARATGVTQKSLLEAAKTTSSKITKTTTASKTTSKKTTSKTTSSPSKAKKTTSSGSALELTSTEKTLVQLYRKADADTKKAAMSLLKGEKAEGSDIVSSLLGSVIEKFTGKQ